MMIQVGATVMQWLDCVDFPFTVKRLVCLVKQNLTIDISLVAQGCLSLSDVLASFPELHHFSHPATVGIVSMRHKLMS